MNKGLIINEQIWWMIDDLEPEEKATLLTALSAYYKGTEIPCLDRIVGMVFKRIAADNAKFDPEHKQAVSEIRSEAAHKRWDANDANNANDANVCNPEQDKDIDKDKDKDIDKDKDEDEKLPVYMPVKAGKAGPSVREVREYAEEEGLVIDAERFVAYYAAKDWKTGTDPIKDWKKVARKWAVTERKEKPPDKKKPGKFSAWLESQDYSNLVNGRRA